MAVELGVGKCEEVHAGSCRYPASLVCFGERREEASGRGPIKRDGSVTES